MSATRKVEREHLQALVVGLRRIAANHPASEVIAMSIEAGAWSSLADAIESLLAPRAQGEERIEYGVRRKGEAGLLHGGPVNASGLDVVLANLGTRYSKDREVVQRRVVTEPWTPTTPPPTAKAVRP